MRNSARVSNLKGFTMIELLVVVAIIAILTFFVAFFINPLELRRRSNDAVRLTDLANLHQAINVAAQEATASDSGILCFGGTSPCSGNSNDTGESVRRTDGTGWVKVNLSSQRSVSVPTLPVDPINDNNYRYSYYSDDNGWEINAVLESDQQIGKMSTDGGDNDNVYEIGSNLTLIN